MLICVFVGVGVCVCVFTDVCICRCGGVYVFTDVCLKLSMFICIFFIFQLVSNDFIYKFY